MEITGKIHFIDETRSPSENFKVRTFCIDTSTDVNGTIYESFAGLQFVNAKCANLDGLGIGDEVKVTFGIGGKPYTPKEAKPTEQNPKGEKIIANLNASKIELIAKATTIQNTPAPASNPAAAGAPASGAPAEAGPDDLPF